MTLLVVLTMVVAVVAAVRSTWSPCGLSMLSTITPLSEDARGHRYGVTASWFVLGAVAGGVTLGALGAGLAALVASLDASATSLLALAALYGLVATASDLRVGGFRLPAHRRQVDEVWLTGFRPWVYGLGFGWQIGVGLATYITTAAVYLLAALSALTASPAVAMLAGVVFGTVRGLAVLLGARVSSPSALRALHARLDALDAPAAWWTAAVLAVVTVAAAAAMSPIAGVVVVALAVPALAVRRLRPARGAVAPV